MPRTVKKDKHLAPGQPAKPLDLPARAALEWDRLGAELVASRIQITPAHRSILEQASRLTAEMAECIARVDKDGAYIETKAGLVSHPASKRLDALRRDYIKVLTMLGLRTAVPEAAPSTDETLNDLLGD